MKRERQEEIIEKEDKKVDIQDESKEKKEDDSESSSEASWSDFAVCSICIYRILYYRKTSRWVPSFQTAVERRVLLVDLLKKYNRRMKLYGFRSCVYPRNYLQFRYLQYMI